VYVCVAASSGSEERLKSNPPFPAYGNYNVKSAVPHLSYNESDVTKLNHRVRLQAIFNN